MFRIVPARSRRIGAVLLLAAATVVPALLPSPSFAAGEDRVVTVTAKRFEYSPNEIRLKKGVPVVIELSSLDRLHGFSVPDLGVRADVEPGKTARVRIVPDRAGTFPFHCDIFCGDGHGEMEGKIVVEE